MTCTFLNKYADKLLTDSLNTFERSSLNKHMESCEECRKKYSIFLEQDMLIRKAALRQRAPLNIASDVMHALGRGRYSRKDSNIKKYMAAAIIIAAIFIPMTIGYSSGVFKNLIQPPKKETVSELNLQSDNNLMERLRNYIKAEEGIKTAGGEVFVSIDFFGAQEKDGHIYSYMWALIEEIRFDNGDYMHSSGSSIPIAVKLEKRDGEYYPISCTVPRDGSYYMEDIKKIFPEEYRSKVLKRQGQVKDLEDMNDMQAREYYKTPIKDYSLGLSPELNEVYRKFAGERKDEILKGLQPIDLYKMYFHAKEIKDYETLYALYYKDGKWLVPSHDDFMKDVKNDTVSEENDKKLRKALNEDVESAYFVFSNKNEGYIQLCLKKESPYYEGGMGFSLLRGDNNIWKVQWLPMQ